MTMYRALAFQVRPTARTYHALGILQCAEGRPDLARRTLQTGLRLPDKATDPQV